MPIDLRICVEGHDNENDVHLSYVVPSHNYNVFEQFPEWLVLEYCKAKQEIEKFHKKIIVNKKKHLALCNADLDK